MARAAPCRATPKSNAEGVNNEAVDAATLEARMTGTFKPKA